MLQVRAIAHGVIDLQEPDWEAYADMFVGPVGDRFVNLAVGMLPWSELHTPGVLNVAIAGDIPRPLNPGEIQALKKWDAVYGVRESDGGFPFTAGRIVPRRLAEELCWLATEMKGTAG